MLTTAGNLSKPQALLFGLRVCSDRGPSFVALTPINGTHWSFPEPSSVGQKGSCSEDDEILEAKYMGAKKRPKVLCKDEK